MNEWSSAAASLGAVARTGRFMTRVYPQVYHPAMAETALALQESAARPVEEVLGRAWFRFASVWLFLQIFPFPAGSIPGTGKVQEWYEGAWNRIVPWFGEQVLHLSHAVWVPRNGSGDRTFDYVQAAIFTAIAAVVAAIWTALDRRDLGERLRPALRIYVRYWLGTVMITYGAAKFAGGQFPSPPGNWLLETYGESTPMRLLWTFMGFSQTYSAYAGFAECLGGALLFFRRTTTLGALVSAAVLSNIVMMNFCYDVPVKLYSSVLLAAAISLAWRDGRRIADFFFRNRPTEPAELGASHRVRNAAKAVLIAALLWQPLIGVWHRVHQKPLPFAGFYQVEHFKGWRPWKYLEISWGALVIRTDGSRARYGFSSEPNKKTGTFAAHFTEGNGGPSWALDLSEKDGLLRIAGTLAGETIDVQLRKVDEPPFQLTTRGFHWINEFPFNR